MLYLLQYLTVLPLQTLSKLKETSIHSLLQLQEILHHLRSTNTDLLMPQRVELSLGCEFDSELIQ